MEINAPDAGALYEIIVEQAPDALIFADREGAIRVWNRGAEDIFGYAPSEVLGSSIDIIIPEPLRKAHWQGFDRALGSGTTKYAGRVLTTRSVHKDGRRLYVDLSFALLRDVGGDIVGALAIARDCTERYLAEKARASGEAAAAQAARAP
jgi:PAS domain S-box-containing protein